MGETSWNALNGEGEGACVQQPGTPVSFPLQRLHLEQTRKNEKAPKNRVFRTTDICALLGTVWLFSSVQTQLQKGGEFPSPPLPPIYPLNFGFGVCLSIILENLTLKKLSVLSVLYSISIQKAKHSF